MNAITTFWAHIPELSRFYLNLFAPTQQIAPEYGINMKYNSLYRGGVFGDVLLMQRGGKVLKMCTLAETRGGEGNDLPE